jgi:hypothetical protein
MVQTFQMKCKSTVQYEPVMTTMEYAKMERAARIIQNSWRVWYYEKGGREFRGPVKHIRIENESFDQYLPINLDDQSNNLRRAHSAPKIVSDLRGWWFQN